MMAQGSDAQETTERLLDHPLGREAKQILAREMVTIRIPKGQSVFYENTPVQGIHFIQKGKVKVYKTGLNERSQIIRLAGDGDVLGHRGFGGKDLYPIGAETLEDSLIHLLETETFLEILRLEPELAIKFMFFYADELKRTETRLRDQSQMLVREKIMDALLMVLDAFGTDEEGYLAAVLPRMDFASIAGTSQEQVSRFLSEFRDEGSIELNGKRVRILDPEHFREQLAPYRFVEGY